ncbi:MAG TPA: hypothetical protein VE010_05005 [Thermoanaerobaculia bacterium]|nr:hypothetical protein [Thermoanaerobaculia bacterium]
MADESKRTKTFSVALALAGIAIELIAIVLMASDRISVPTAMPLIIAGMFLAFAPIFLAARRARR